MSEQAINYTPAASLHGEETRQKLISAATPEFIEQGFRAARVQQIAKQAGVRLSAINYHFGGKDGLYLAVLRHHGELAIKQRPLLTDTEQPLQQHFRFMIHSLLQRMVDDSQGCQLAQLMLREMVNPTAAQEDIFQRFQYPQIQQVFSLLRQILPHADQTTLLRCTLSLFSQCIIYVLARPLILRTNPDLLSYPSWLEDIENHIVRFSWAGLIALQEASHA
jgi:TetR/AcrR family transcriptional regulator, regulator of cefoperazone and chloramphenicol sensitivity